MVAIIGESGTGKSTLLHLLSGLDRPSSGDVYFDTDSGPRPLAGMNEEALADFRNREIGFVWQQHYLLPEFTALENVMMPLLIAGHTPTSATAQAQQGLEQVGLGQRLMHRAGELSGGEQQRVAMARALANHPRFLMADEPTGNLDERTGAALFDLLGQLHHRQGLTSIVVTHNQAQARRCDRVLRLVEGQLQDDHRNATAMDDSGSQQVNPYV
jgi:lipoprotein-releasing system ATP-binding protein